MAAAPGAVAAVAAATGVVRVPGAVVAAAAHGEAGAAVEAVRGVFIFDPDVVEGVRRTGLFDSHNNVVLFAFFLK